MANYNAARNIMSFSRGFAQSQAEWGDRRARDRQFVYQMQASNRRLRLMEDEALLRRPYQAAQTKFLEARTKELGREPDRDDFPGDIDIISDYRQQQELYERTQLPSGVSGPSALPPNLAQLGGLRTPLGQKFAFGQLGDGKPESFTLSPGQTRFSGTGEEISSVPGQQKYSQSSSVIMRDGNAIRVRNTFDQEGNLVNQQEIGQATLAEKIGGVAAEGLGLQKPTQTKIEQDIIELDTTMAELDTINEQISDEYFTFRGKGKAFFTALAEKLEIPVGAAHQQFLSDRTKFFADSKRVFLKFRKFITGVAGGIEEFREIAKATIDPENDSPTQFKAKMKSMRENVTRTRNVLMAIRNSGLDLNDPAVRNQVFRGLQLGAVPLEVPEDVTLETLYNPSASETQKLTPDEIEAELRRRGIE